MTRRSKRTLRFGEVAPKVLSRADRSGRRHGARAAEAWPVVAGPDIARHTRGFALRDSGEFVVFVDNAAWANQLSLMADDLRSRLNEHMGDKAVRSLRFTVSRTVGERMMWEMAESTIDELYQPDETPPQALDDVELMQARHVASVVKDPGLREVALKAMVKDLELKKGARARRVTPS